MNLDQLQKTWDDYGKTDPLWAVLTYGDKMGNRWDPEAFFATGREEIASVMRHLDSLGVKLNRGQALDFGCGVGRLTQALAPHFEEVCGVDIAPSMIEQARQYNRFGEKCRYYLNEADDLSLFPNDHFDFVFTLITLQHMAPPFAKSYLREFLRLLAPGGILVFQLPAATSWQYRVRQGIKRAIPAGALRRYRQARYHSAPLEETSGAMEMHTTGKAEVVHWLESHGGCLLDVRRDQHAGNFISYRYTVRKA